MESFVAAVEWIRDTLSAATSDPSVPSPPVPWSWTASQLAELATQFPTGITKTIILAEIESRWLRACKQGVATKFTGVPNIASHSDSPVSSSTRFNLRIEKIKLLPAACPDVLALVLGNVPPPGASSKMAEQNQTGSKFTIEMILHSKFKFVVDGSLGSQDALKSGINGVRFTSALLTKRTPSLPQRFLPIEQLIFMISETSPLLKGYFTHRLQNITPMNVNQVFFLRFQVVSISPPTFHKNRILRRVQMMDPSSAKTVDLVLRDADAKLADLFEPMDVLGIHNPFVHEACFSKLDGERYVLKEMEYGSWTVLFCVPSSDEKASASSQSEVVAISKDLIPLDENGCHDFKGYPARFSIQDLRTSQKNFSILGTIVRMINNLPIEKDGKKVDRFGIRLMDDQGHVVDVTLWDQVGNTCRTLQLGQTVFVQNLCTTAQQTKEKGDKFYVIGNSEFGTKVFCYPVCGKLLETRDSILYCRFCSVFPPNKGSHSLHVCLQISDDSISSMEVEVRGRVADEILGVSGPEFNAMKSERRIAVLESMKGKVFEFYVSAFKERKVFLSLSCWFVLSR
ncbi:hypothetical protein HDU98_009687 [Podochytrium sp. JEL0797]|nr:hypothetical protein HDU98_009687 [Podochytrium sp. JEL0797]